MKTFFMAMLTMVAMSAQAASPANSEPVITNAPRIIEQQTRLQAEVLSGKGVFKDMDATVRNDLLKHQEVVFDLLKGKELVTQLSQPDQVRVQNALSGIVAAVNNTQDERMVCRREKATGSHRPETTCKTVAQRREEREQSRNSLTAPRDSKCGNACGESMQVNGW